MAYDLTTPDASRGEAYLKKIAENLGVDVGDISHDITAAPKSRMEAYLQAIIANMGGGGGGGGGVTPAELAKKQDKVDAALNTDDKSVVGAINEILNYVVEPESAELDLAVWREKTEPLNATITAVSFLSEPPTEADTIDFGNGIRGSMDGGVLTLRSKVGVDITDATEMFADFTALETVPDYLYVRGPAQRMFAGCTALESVETVLLYSAESAAHAFEGCTKLQRVGDLRVTEATDLSYLFAGCTALTECRVESQIVQNVSHMFEGCENLQSASIPRGEITDASYLFAGCTSLTTITDGRDQRLGSYGEVDVSHMFDGCTSLAQISLRYSDLTCFSPADHLFSGVDAQVVASVGNDAGEDWIETNAATTDWPSTGTIMVEAPEVEPQQVYYVNNKTGYQVDLDASDVGALPVSGGTATGPVTVKPAGAAGLKISSDNSGGAITVGEDAKAVNMVLTGKTTSAPATVQLFDGSYNPVKVSGVADPTEDYDAATKAYVDALGKVSSVKVAETRPEQPAENTLYYVGTESPYHIWLYAEQWYDMGTTELNLSDYVTRAMLTNALAQKQDKLTDEQLAAANSGVTSTRADGWDSKADGDLANVKNAVFKAKVENCGLALPLFEYKPCTFMDKVSGLSPSNSRQCKISEKLYFFEAYFDITAKIDSGYKALCKINSLPTGAKGTPFIALSSVLWGSYNHVEAYLYSDSNVLYLKSESSLASGNRLFISGLVLYS